MAIREARWDCQYCGTTGILGRHRECPNCGRSRPEGTKFYLSDEPMVVTDARLVEQAKIGPDWICQFCGTSNAADAEICRSCGAPRDATGPTQQVKEYQPGQAPTSGDMDLDATPEAPAAPARPKLPKWAPVAIGAVILLFVVGLAIALGGNKDVSAAVSGFRWERTLAVEELRTVQEESFTAPALALNATILDQRQEIERYDQVLDHYETRERQVSEQVQTGVRTYVCGQRDLGNGFFEDIECTEPIYETQYRTETYQEPIYTQVPVYGTLYVYNVDKWVADRTEEASGRDHSPFWPRADLGEDEREGERTERYFIIFTDDEGREYETELPLAEWQQYEVGQRVTLELDSSGRVKQLVP